MIKHLQAKTREQERAVSNPCLSVKGVSMQSGPCEKLDSTKKSHRASSVEKKQGNNCWLSNAVKINFSERL